MQSWWHGAQWLAHRGAKSCRHSGGSKDAGTSCFADAITLARRSLCPPSPQFHLNRAGVWGVALLRVLASGEWGIAASICLVLLLPAITHTLPLRLYTRCVDMHVLVGSAH